MDPVEINAGAWYLRALRADERIDDRPALADLGETDAEYVTRSLAGWEQDRVYSWAVCEPTTGELLGEVVLDVRTGMIRLRARRGHTEATQTVADSVRRFAESIGAS
ncbi:hypothetical protein Y900_006675 [Mycolicibacterium aromaticivorans JS19b1 = JCM 16368]|uniref:Uncharacterized protein n=1 Tax=Mycolicibacterium aromaticivorans JS19b1 = JCM 16368 TaxID=1440774 RepID=A0A064CDB4_9MYCO|nr:hypothetical protein [Mycolicibacterium aromaticivorans]KDE98634.1 hypothetical protein Y900_006675 [Mycolicibacterium aromaticivorans JS19b1 = JCM 16368]